MDGEEKNINKMKARVKQPLGRLLLFYTYPISVKARSASAVM
jgi:hypothetical protein